MLDMDATDRKLLDAVQAGIPLVERPYRALGEGSGLAEGDVLERIDRLKADGFIRNIGAIFDTSRLGYRSSLVGFRVREESVDEAAALINAHPGVSHNYLRRYTIPGASGLEACCPYNIWFTLAVSPESRLGLEASVETLARETGADAARLFPALRVFKIRVRLDMDTDAAGVRKEEGHSLRATVIPSMAWTTMSGRSCGSCKMICRLWRSRFVMLPSGADWVSMRCWPVPGSFSIGASCAALRRSCTIARPVIPGT